MVKQFAFFIPGPLPGLNELINVARGTKRGNLAAAHQKRVWTNRISLYVLVEMNKHSTERFAGPVFVSCLWKERNKKRDPDNVISAKKFLFDGMVEAGLLRSDGWKSIAGVQDKWIVDKDNAGVLVTVSEVEE